MTGLFKKNIKWFEEHGIISSECFDKLEKKPKTYGHLLPDFSIWENREELRNMFHDAVVSQRTTLFEKLAVEEKKEKKMTNTEFVQHKHDFAKSIMRNLENYIGAPLPWDEINGLTIKEITESFVPKDTQYMMNLLEAAAYPCYHCKIRLVHLPTSMALIDPKNYPDGKILCPKCLEKEKHICKECGAGNPMYYKYNGKSRSVCTHCGSTICEWKD